MEPVGGEIEVARRSKQAIQDDTIREWFGWINSTNAEELRKSFVKFLAEKGYKIEEVK